MESNPALLDIVLGAPVTNALAAAALGFSAAALFAKKTFARPMLALSCIAALSMPLYDLIPFSWDRMRSGAPLDSLVTTAVLYFMLTPGSLVQLTILLWINKIDAIAKAILATIPSIIVSWLGMTFIHLVIYSD